MKTSPFEKKLRRRTRGVVLIQALRGAFFVFLSTSLLVYLVFLVAYFFPHRMPFSVTESYLCGIWLGPPFLAAVVVIFFQRLNLRKLTFTLELHYPHLRDRLVTAMEVCRKESSMAANPFSRALARSLQKEVSTLLDRFGFGKATSLRKLSLPLLLFFLFLVFGSVHAMIQPDFLGTAFYRVTHPAGMEIMAKDAPAVPVLPDFEIEVVPGDCEVAKGSNLLIQARVAGHEPQQVALHTKEDQKTGWRIFPMEHTENGTYRYMLTHITEAADYYVKVDFKHSSTYRIRLFERLDIVRALWKVVFPDYMDIPEQVRQGWRRKMTVPRGTELHFNLLLNRPVQPGMLVEKGGERFFLRRKSDAEWETRLVADRDLLLTLDVRSREGELLTGLPPLWIQTIPDLSPYLEVLEPQLHNYVFPTQEIPFKISVNDDYGIRSVSLVIRYQEKEERIEWLPKGESPDEIVLTPVLDLERFQLHSKDLVVAFLEVRDTYPGEDAHLIRSPLFTFLIRDYVEQFKLNQPDPDQPSLRILFEDILVGQEEIMQDTWDYISRLPVENPTGWQNEEDSAGTEEALFSKASFSRGEMGR